jgi:hypothetical protein
MDAESAGHKITHRALQQHGSIVSSIRETPSGAKSPAEQGISGFPLLETDQAPGGLVSISSGLGTIQGPLVVVPKDPDAIL